MSYKILFSNIGYAKGIDGSLKAHVKLAHRHFYSGVRVQRKVLAQIKNVIDVAGPDLCCFVEIDRGSVHSAQLNQIQELMDEDYRYHDIANKYGEKRLLGRLPLHIGKSNAFLAKTDLAFERLYFRYGSKRLIYKLRLPNGAHILFAHFSLNRRVRYKQFLEAHDLIQTLGGEVILMADFNIYYGFGELQPLVENTGLIVLNNEAEHTFAFHRRRQTLDLCLCTPGVADSAMLEIIPQPYSDHAALLLDLPD